jgi:hypothetical protein
MYEAHGEIRAETDPIYRFGAGMVSRQAIYISTRAGHLLDHGTSGLSSCVPLDRVNTLVSILRTHATKHV